VIVTETFTVDRGVGYVRKLSYAVTVHELHAVTDAVVVEEAFVKRAVQGLVADLSS
jgi:hypothetical protein